MNAAGADGYPWSRREEMKALAITKGWRAVFNSMSHLSILLSRLTIFVVGGQGTTDAALNTKEFVLASIARDLIKTHGFVLAFGSYMLEFGPTPD